MRYTLKEALDGDYGDDVKEAAKEMQGLSKDHLVSLAHGRFKGTPLCHGCADKLAGIRYATDLACNRNAWDDGKGKYAWRSCMFDDEPYRTEMLSTPLSIARNTIVPQLAEQLLPPPPVPSLAALASDAVPPDANTSRLGPFDSLKKTERAERAKKRRKKTPYSRDKTTGKKGGRRRTHRKKPGKRKRAQRTRTSRRKPRS